MRTVRAKKGKIGEVGFVRDGFGWHGQKSRNILPKILGYPGIQNPPRPENPRKLLENYNLAHPGPVLKITEKLLGSVIF